MDSEAFLKDTLKFYDVYSGGYANIIGALIPDYLPIIFLVTGGWSVYSVSYSSFCIGTLNLDGISYTSLMIGQNPETSLKLEYDVTVIVIIKN